MCVLIHIVYVSTGCGGWTRWCVLKVTFAYDCYSSLLNTGDLFFHVWKEMGCFSPPHKLLQPSPGPRMTKANQLVLIFILIRNRSAFEDCRAIVEDDSNWPVTSSTVLNKKTFIRNIDWQKFKLLLNLARTKGRAKMTLYSWQWHEVEW